MAHAWTRNKRHGDKRHGDKSHSLFGLFRERTEQEKGILPLFVADGKYEEKAFTRHHVLLPHGTELL